MSSTMKYILSLSLFVLFTGITGCHEPELNEPAKVHVEKTAAKNIPTEMVEVPENSATLPTTLGKSNGILVANTMVYDFGKVEPNQKINGEFILTNEGKQPVKMKQKVRTSCSCVAMPTLEKLELAPGESGKLTFVYTTKTTPGTIMQRLYIDVTEGSPKVLPLALKTEVQKVITVEPDTLTFKLESNAPQAIEFTLNALDKKPFLITSINGLGTQSSTTYDKDKSAATQKVTATFAPEDLRKHPKGWLFINTNHPKATSLRVPFETTLPFAVRPPSKQMMNVQPGKVYKSKIHILSNYNTEFEIGKVTSENNYATMTKTTKTKGGYILDVEFVLPEDKSPKYFRDYLHVEIKDHPMDMQKVLFYGTTQQ
ncbi:MAG: DUF1573 domain-containing protein [Phycisphaerae bacterium]|nr:DUF1573 domain-containing protein [Phycisphaerae bacterium]